MTERELLAKAALKRKYGQRTAWLLGPYITDTGYARVLHCGDSIELVAHKDNPGDLQLGRSYNCGNRWCPGCAWRQSLDQAHIIHGIWQAMLDAGKVPILIGLTIPNVPGNKLSDALDLLAKSYNVMMRRQRYRTAWSDSIRKLEVTYNRAADTYHPHLHVLAYVDGDYWGQHYISHDQLLSDWRDVTGISQITQVDIRRCTTTGDKIGAICEVAKYIAKSADYTISARVFDVIFRATYHRKYITYAGECARLRREIDSTQVTDKDLDGIIGLLYYWMSDEDGYIQTSVYDITTKPEWHEISSVVLDALHMPTTWDEICQGVADQ